MQASGRRFDPVRLHQTLRVPLFWSGEGRALEILFVKSFSRLLFDIVKRNWLPSLFSAVVEDACGTYPTNCLIYQTIWSGKIVWSIVVLID